MPTKEDITMMTVVVVVVVAMVMMMVIQHECPACITPLCDPIWNTAYTC